jgi:hypothetical protein
MILYFQYWLDIRFWIPCNDHRSTSLAPLTVFAAYRVVNVAHGLDQELAPGT